MSFHVLSAMNICGRHKRSDEDHRPPGETVTTSTSDKEDVAVNDDDPEAGMRVPTEPRAHIRGEQSISVMRDHSLIHKVGVWSILRSEQRMISLMPSQGASVDRLRTVSSSKAFKLPRYGRKYGLAGRTTAGRLS